MHCYYAIAACYCCERPRVIASLSVGYTLPLVAVCTGNRKLASLGLTNGQMQRYGAIAASCGDERLLVVIARGVNLAIPVVATASNGTKLVRFSIAWNLLKLGHNADVAPYILVDTGIIGASIAPTYKAITIVGSCANSLAALTLINGLNGVACNAAIRACNIGERVRNNRFGLKHSHISSIACYCYLTGCIGFAIAPLLKGVALLGYGR